ncbi:unnamed protein product [Cyclocybe aegerita]|uniref:Uncharacterized protein n=1 Tax=Cyclocybe aegerita TaxID=1973307 RepID=A0A8S0W5F9_CYCAE|nr:unnamed protein product [Cyclocybe aegerita]
MLLIHASHTELNNEGADRPTKRKRKEGNHVEVQLPDSLPAYERGVEESSRFGESRVTAYVRALEGVNRRISGVTPEEDPITRRTDLTGYTGDSDDESGNESSDSQLEDFLNFDKNYAPPPTDHVESNDKREEQENLNQYNWNKVQSAYCKALEQIIRRNPTVSGLALVAGQVKHANHLFGVGELWAPVILVCSENTVLAGLTAQHYVDELKRADMRHPPKMLPNTPVYKAAPQGYPMTPMEVDALVAVACNRTGHKHPRAEAHVLLQSFHAAATRIDRSQRDDAMHCILDSTVFEPTYFPEFMENAHSYIIPPMVPPTQHTRSSNQNSSSGYGLAMPTNPFDIIARCQYVIAHQMIGTPNAIKGVIIDFAGRVYLPTMFAYLLAKLLSPVAKQASKMWIALFAHIHPTAPFVESIVPTYIFHSLELTDSTYRNATEDNVVNDLIRNGIPVAWVDHAYTFGLRVLNQTVTNFG